MSYYYRIVFYGAFFFTCNKINTLQVHKIKIKESRWNRSYKNLLWRVDVEAMSKDGSESGEPIALFEFVTTAGSSKYKQTDSQQTAKFDMNRDQVLEMLAACDAIQKKFDESSC